MRREHNTTTPSIKLRQILLPVVVLGMLLWITPAQAATTQTRKNQLRVAQNPAITLFGGTFNNGASVAVADVTGDGIDDYIVGAGEGGGPQIEIYAKNGTAIRRFFAWPKSMTSGLYVAAGDLDGDGVAEIAVGTMAGTSGVVRVFSSTGTLLKSVTPFEASYMGGVQPTILPARNGEMGKVIVGSGFGREPEVRVFGWPTLTKEHSWSPFGKTFGNGVPVAAAWSDTYSQPILVIGNGAGYKPKVQVYGLTSKTVLTSWLAFDQKNLSGVFVAVRADTIAVALGSGAIPMVETYRVDGSFLQSYLAFESNFRGGVLVALELTDDQLSPVVVPSAAPKSAIASGKSITVNLKKQRLYMYQHGRLVGVHVVSTGKWGTPTPTGKFQTRNKIPTAYSRAYNLYMESWMAITPDGKYGLHSLPYWKLKNGGKLYEGASHLGTPVSHGCIRQSTTEAKQLYDWAPIGTPVTIVAS